MSGTALDDDRRRRIRGEASVQRQLTSSHRRIDIHLHGSSVEGLRLDRLLPILCPTLSRSLFQLWISRGDVQINGSVASAATRVRRDDRIQVYTLLPPNPEDLQHHDAGLHILHEENDFLVVDKPPGQLVHQAGRVFHGTLLGQVQQYLEERGRDPEQARLVNRIDRETSGLVLIGLTADTQRSLSMALERRDVEKTYLALCHGCPEPAQGHWRQPIGAGDDGTPKRRIRSDGQPCHTEYQVLEERHGVSLLQITLHTGRQHQIRLHAAHNGHPLLGDWIYGQPCEGLPGQALHAHRLVFAHPHHGRPLQVISPLPDVLAHIWEACAQGRLPAPRALSPAEQLRLKDPEEGQRLRRLPDWLPEDLRLQVRREARQESRGP